MVKSTLVLAVLCLGTVAPLAAQSGQQPSLGDVARQLRQKEKDERKAAKVITNDNLPAPVPGEALTILPANPSSPAKPEPTASKPSSPDAGPGNDKPPVPESKPKTREEWQSAFKAAHEDLSRAKELEQLSEDELNLLQIQEAREINQVAKADLDAKIQAKQAEVETNKAATDKAQKKLSDLEQELKDSGAPADWGDTEMPKETPGS